MSRKSPVARLLPIVAAAGILAACNVNGSVRIDSSNASSAKGSTVNGQVSVADGVAYTTEDLSTVNGSVTVGAGSTVRRAKTVNGAVTVGAGATAESLSTTNGSVRVADKVTVESEVHTTNGSITVGQDCTIGGRLVSTNGSVEAGKGSTIAEDATTVNGRVTLNGASTKGDVSIVNGGIFLDEGAHVGGIVHVRRPTKLDPKDKIPVVVIGRDVVVDGEMIFDRPVELHVHESAKHGAIGGQEGATPISYSSDAPALK